MALSLPLAVGVANTALRRPISRYLIFYTWAYAKSINNRIFRRVGRSADWGGALLRRQHAPDTVINCIIVKHYAHFNVRTRNWALRVIGLVRDIHARRITIDDNGGFSSGVGGSTRSKISQIFLPVTLLWAHLFTMGFIHFVVILFLYVVFWVTMYGVCSFKSLVLDYCTMSDKI